MSLTLPAILIATALRGTLDLSNRVQLATRAGGSLTDATIDADTSPQVKLGLQTRSWELTADYSPRFTGNRSGGDTQSYLLQQGRLATRFRDRRVSISLTEDGGHGRLSLLSLGAVPGAIPGTTPLTASPTSSILDYAWSRTGIVARLAASRRWGVSLLGDLTLSGGASAGSRATLPFQTALHAGVGVEYAASRQDRVATLLDASKARFSSGEDDALLQGKLSWRHELGPSVATTFAAGLGCSISRADTSPAARSVAAPIVESAITYHPRASSFDVGLTLRLAPVIDAFRGQVEERVEGMASIGWTPTRELAVQGQLGVARSIPKSDGTPISLGSGSILASYRLSEVVQLDAGGRSAWTNGAGLDFPPQWTVFVGATLRIPTLRF